MHCSCCLIDDSNMPVRLHVLCDLSCRLVWLLDNPMGIKAGCRHSVCVHKCGFGLDCKSVNRRQRPAVRCCDQTFMQRCPWPVEALHKWTPLKFLNGFSGCTVKPAPRFYIKQLVMRELCKQRGKQWAVTSHEYPDDRCLEGVWRNAGSLQDSHSLSHSSWVSVSLTNFHTQAQRFRQTPAGSFLADCTQSLSRHTSGGEAGCCALQSSATW